MGMGIAAPTAALLAVLAVPQAVKPLRMELGSATEIGRAGDVFSSISSVCEDNAGNICVVDFRDFLVRRFRTDGRPAGTFGSQGQGPGDFQAPNRITLLPRGEIAVLEDISYVSIFDGSGKFLRRLDINGRLDLGYVGPDRFYAWDWTPDFQQQLLVDGKGRVVRELGRRAREPFTARLPDRNGRHVMFTYASDEYVPPLLFDSAAGTAATGTGDRYEIHLLDETGREKGVVRRDIAPLPIGRREREVLEKRVQEHAAAHKFPAAVARTLAGKIPSVRNLIKAVRVSPRFLFVVRPAPDLSTADTALPVDVFTLTGLYLGTLTLPGIPIAVTARAMYYVRSDDSGIEYLECVPFSLPGV